MGNPWEPLVHQEAGTLHGYYGSAEFVRDAGVDVLISVRAHAPSVN